MSLPASSLRPNSTLHESGLESLLMCFFDPQQGLHQMEDHIMPALKKMGLRK